MLVKATKVCAKCGLEGTLDEFNRGSRGSFGRTAWCRGCFREYNQERYFADLETSRARMREASERWRMEHPGYHSEWAKEHPENGRVQNSRRRARLRGAVTSADTSAFVKHLAVTPCECVYCDKLMPNGAEHIDHVVPLSRGGAHTPENLVPACAHCNTSKGAKLVEEWFP